MLLQQTLDKLDALGLFGMVLGLREQPEHDFDEGALTGAVRPDEPDDAGLDIHRQIGQRGHPAAVRLRQRLSRDDGHAP